MSDQPSVVAAVQQRGFFGGGEPKEVAPRTFHVPTMANATAFLTNDGVVQVDSGVIQTGPLIKDAVRSYTDAPIHTVIYTHGHIDHAMGVGTWIEAGEKPDIVAHEGAMSFKR